MTRPWIMHQGTIYMGDPGQTHDEVVQKFKVPPSDDRDEGVVEDGKVSAHNKELIPQVLRYYDKHYKDDDTIRIAAPVPEKEPNLGYYARLVLADIEEGLKVNSATKISGSHWAYLNGQIRQGEYYPDLIYNLAKDQGLQEAEQLSNLVAVNDWPLTEHNLAIGSWWNGKPQIERSNLDRQEVVEAIRALAGS